MAKGNHSFTESDIRRRFGAIVGHTVAEVDTAGVLAASKASRNKGRIGAVIEQSVLGYPADSDRRPDILIDGRPWEVKATGLVEGARGGWRAKEPMSITAVAPEGIVAESFSTSAFQYCDLREIYDPSEVFNVALQYESIPYRKWSSPLDLKEIGMDDLSLHEKCALQLGWEPADKDTKRDRADMSVEELIELGESKAEDRELEIWLHGYMDPYEGEIDTTRYSRTEIVDKLLFN